MKSSRLRSFIACACACDCSALAMSGVATPARAAGEGAADAAFDAALVAYERNHWQQAYDAFASLADQGHREAARIALLM